jgi:hypothetical protein
MREWSVDLPAYMSGQELINEKNQAVHDARDRGGEFVRESVDAGSGRVRLHFVEKASVIDSGSAYHYPDWMYPPGSSRY